LIDKISSRNILAFIIMMKIINIFLCLELWIKIKIFNRSKIIVTNKQKNRAKVNNNRRLPILMIRFSLNRKFKSSKILMIKLFQQKRPLKNHMLRLWNRKRKLDKRYASRITT